MKKMTDDEKKVPISIAFDRDILAKIENTKGRMSRSSFVNISVEKVLKMEARKARRS